MFHGFSEPEDRDSMTKFVADRSGRIMGLKASWYFAFFFFLSFSFRARVGMMFLFRLDPDEKSSFFSKSSEPQ